MVIPDALKVLRLQAGHKYCLLGKLSSEIGWNHYDTIKELEKKRKERSQIVYERKKQLTKLRVQAKKVAAEKLDAQLDIIAPPPPSSSSSSSTSVLDLISLGAGEKEKRTISNCV